MTVMYFKINSKLKLEVVNDDKTDSYGCKLMFKFNSHHSNWLYIKMKKSTSNKLKDILQVLEKKD